MFTLSSLFLVPSQISLCARCTQARYMDAFVSENQFLLELLHLHARGAGAAAEEVPRGEGGEDGHARGGQQAADHAGGGLLAEAGVDVAELAPLQGLHAQQPHEARLQRRHRRREHHVRASLQCKPSWQQQTFRHFPTPQPRLSKNTRTNLYLYSSSNCQCQRK